ncbi:hypothetical protein Bbelb_324960 [Branchiostoma belcheri]|nr:hypothetical protein Bbelb_324960 [Branchiostoma belcheri]
MTLISQLLSVRLLVASAPRQHRPSWERLLRWREMRTSRRSFNQAKRTRCFPEFHVFHHELACFSWPHSEGLPTNRRVRSLGSLRLSSPGERGGETVRPRHFCEHSRDQNADEDSGLLAPSLPCMEVCSHEEKPSRCLARLLTYEHADVFFGTSGVQAADTRTSLRLTEEIACEACSYFNLKRASDLYHKSDSRLLRIKPAVQRDGDSTCNFPLRICLLCGALAGCPAEPPRVSGIRWAVTEFGARDLVCSQEPPCDYVNWVSCQPKFHPIRALTGSEIVTLRLWELPYSSLKKAYSSPSGLLLCKAYRVSISTSEYEMAPYRPYMVVFLRLAVFINQYDFERRRIVLSGFDGCETGAACGEKIKRHRVARPTYPLDLSLGKVHGSTLEKLTFQLQKQIEAVPVGCKANRSNGVNVGKITQWSVSLGVCATSLIRQNGVTGNGRNHLSFSDEFLNIDKSQEGKDKKGRRDGGGYFSGKLSNFPGSAGDLREVINREFWPRRLGPVICLYVVHVGRERVDL